MRKHLGKRRLVIGLVIAAAVLGAHGWVVSYLVWKRSLRLAGFVDEMSAPERGDRVLVVAPHPDDEALGCGGLIQQAAAAGARVEVAVMTSGDASELSVLLGERELPWKPENLIKLGRSREQESLRALRHLGLSSRQVHFLGFPNAGLLALWRPQHWRYSTLYASPYTGVSHSPYARAFTPQAPYCGQQVLADLMALLQHLRPTHVFVTHPRDIHPDHWVTSCFAQYALATLAARGEEWAETTQVWGYLVHWPRFPAPMRSGLHLELLPPPELIGPGTQWHLLLLSEEEARRKLQAVRQYRSQVPRFDRLLLQFPRGNEIFERLSPVALNPAARAEWSPRGAPRRGLGGSEITRVRLALGPGDAQAELVTSRRRLPEEGYVALDLRGWDEHAAPVLVTLLIGGPGKTDATLLDATSGPRPLEVKVETDNRGQTTVRGLRLPPEMLAHRRLFVSCWGSVRDRLTQPAVGSQVSFQPEADE